MLKTIIYTFSLLFSLGIKTMLVYTLIKIILATKKVSRDVNMIDRNKIYIHNKKHSNIVVIDKDENIIVHINGKGEVITENGYKVKADYKNKTNINN